VAADVYRMPFAPGVFDAATMIRTLHHMAAPLEAIKQIRNALAPEAAFILEFANKRNLKAILRWVVRRQDWNPFDLEPVEFAALNFDFHPRAIREWLLESGFSPGRQLTVSHFRLALLKRLLPTSFLVTMDSIFQWTGNLWQYSPSVFVHATAVGDDPPQSKHAFWRCPICHSIDIVEHERGLRCQGCDRIWPIEDGVYNFKNSIET
jgi:SAM-dependent methyltransferase